MNGRAWLVAGVLAATALSLAMRLPRLSDRPMHTDEAVQAVIAADLWQTGQYRYDRTEYHGPTLPYLTQISLRLSRASGFADTTEAMYRIVPALAGAAMVLLVLLLADGLGRSATLWAAVLMAVSAGLSYYSRYFIHETLLALFTLAAIACGWRWYRDGGLGWAATTGACVGLMAATKETWVIAAACMGAAAIVDWRLRRLYSPLPAGGGRGEGAGAHPGADTASPADADFDELGRVAHPRPLPWGQVGIAAGCAALVATVLFTSFLSNPRGILDAVLAWQPYLSRSGGDPRHVHPWYFYLQPLLWQRYGRGPLFTEAFIIGLAVVGAVASFVRGRQMPLGRVLTFYTVFLTAAYAAIPYKTPWCMLGFLQGMVLLAGIGAATVIQAIPPAAGKWAAGALLAAGTAHLAWVSHNACFTYAASRVNPYVYAHAASDILELEKRLRQLADVSPDGTNMPVRVFSDDPWPLPWYLRRLNKVGYWRDASIASARDDALVVIVSPELDQAVMAGQQERYAQEYYWLRPEVPLLLYVRQDLWSAMLDRRRPGATVPAGHKEPPASGR